MMRIFMVYNVGFWYIYIYKGKSLKSNNLLRMETPNGVLDLSLQFQLFLFDLKPFGDHIFHPISKSGATPHPRRCANAAHSNNRRNKWEMTKRQSYSCSDPKLSVQAQKNSIYNTCCGHGWEIMALQMRQSKSRMTPMYANQAHAWRTCFLVPQVPIVELAIQIH